MTEKEIIKGRPEFEEFLDQENGEGRFLILHNDEVHSFDYVIESLIKVCEMDSIQAEQCTYLVHYKGKCDIKKGSVKELRPFKTALIDRGLEATID